MKWTLEKLRQECYKLLVKPTTTVEYADLKHSAESTYGDDGIAIRVNELKMGAKRCVAHELIHVLLDKHFRDFANYHLYELWIASLEKPFFDEMSLKENKKWERTIRRKL